MRLTDTAWAKLGELASSRGVTRADLIEEWANQGSLQQVDQLNLFGENQLASVEVITADTRKTGTELAHRLQVSSAALTNWLRYGNFLQKSKEHDPDHIVWEREPGLSKKYRPIL
jgi:hypothetical protein